MRREKKRGEEGGEKGGEREEVEGEAMKRRKRETSFCRQGTAQYSTVQSPFRPNTMAWGESCVWKALAGFLAERCAFFGI
jgi:hypothetical protein